MNRRQKGAEKEEQAAAFLEKHGVCILMKNYRTAIGEIDLIGLHEGTLVFFEVKYRSSARYGFPEEAVGIPKQKKISMVSMQYIREEKKNLPEFQAVRYDVISILGTHITWIPAAFLYQGKGWNW